ncbi:MAG: S9 family peptidase [candidate division KSB1 bacterium]|nr:S9 family peptidase [candidate division KSB1 bacterium]
MPLKRLFLIIVILCACLPSFAAGRDLTISDFYRVEEADHPLFSPDSKRLVYEVSRYDSTLNKTRTQLWLTSVESNASKQLTFIGSNNHSPAWCSDNRNIVFVSNRTGESQLWRMNVNNGDMEQMTDMPQGAWSPQWSPDGQKISFLTETRFTGRHPEGLYDIKLYSHLRYRWWYDDNRYDEGWRAHIHTVDAKTKKIHQLTDGDFKVDEMAFSPDGVNIAFVSNRSGDRENNIDTDIWLVPSDGGDITPVFENRGPDYSPQWSANGKYLAWRSTFRYNYESDNYDIIVHELKTGKTMNLTENYDRVVRDLKWHPDSMSLYFIAGDAGNYNLYAIDVMKKKISTVLDRNQRIYGWDISGTGERIAVSVTMPDQPAEIFIIRNRKKGMKRISYVNDLLLEQIQLQDAVTVWFEGDGGTKVQGWYITPQDFEPNDLYPLLLYVHGGPQGMYKNQFDFEFQYMASQGYIVFYTNPRGSFGYGQQFTDAINQDYGGICYRDIMAGIDHMISLGFVDKDRMGVTGLSFGGWMTTWIIGHTDRFDAAVPMAPFVNMFSFYGTTDEQFFPEWDFGGQPYTDSVRQIYEKNSPINHAANFQTPTLIIHGEKDWRCHITEGEQLFTALKKMGVPAVLARVPDEPHVFTQPHHIEASIRMKLDWWKRYIN